MNYKIIRVEKYKVDLLIFRSIKIEFYDMPDGRKDLTARQQEIVEVTTLFPTKGGEWILNEVFRFSTAEAAKSFVGDYSLASATAFLDAQLAQFGELMFPPEVPNSD